MEIYLKLLNEIRKKIFFNNFNEGVVKYDDIVQIINKYATEKNQKDKVILKTINDTIDEKLDIYDYGWNCWATGAMFVLMELGLYVEDK